MSSEVPEGAIAVVGLSGRFPGAADADRLFENLLAKRDGITRLVDELEPEDSSFVRASGYLDGIEFFDADYFGINPREASLIDPQHRLLLECAVTALEHAGYAGEVPGRPVGVFAGAGFNLYLLKKILARPDLVETLGEYAVLLGNDKDFLTTRVSYKLDLTGPSFTLQTACSTSLVAVVAACQALVDYQCDVALAGGVSIATLDREGYRYLEGGILSPDGHCRPFDAAANGTLPASGVGLVVLKRLEDAIDDRDTIHAVIRGWATNNDGGRKVGYTAPSVDAQAKVVSLAQNLAGIAPDSIGYVEAHGTGTALGDPIEVSALGRVFADVARGRCVLGALKASVGHLDAASGVAGLIKAVLAVREGVIPPTLHFRAPHPRLALDESPFRINVEPEPFASTPRRAGVSSFGIGGTNAHVVLEEAPPVSVGRARRAVHLLVLSARTETALAELEARYAARFDAAPASFLADAAYTTQVGRAPHLHRRAIVARDAVEAASLLRDRDHPGRNAATTIGRPVVFLFPGQGAQFGGMAHFLYRDEPVFRAALDACAEGLLPHLGEDLRALVEAGGARLSETRFTQPALFAVEYALAMLLRDLGVVPTAMIGHSLGEYVAACLAGVFSLEDALRVVAERGRLMQSMPAGAMLSVREAASSLRSLLPPGLEMAAENAPNLSVVSGPCAAILAFEKDLAVRGVRARRLETSHAFHCALVDGALPAFRRVLESVTLSPPQIPIVSNVTGALLRDEEATSPDYWVGHLRRPVLFSRGFETLAGDRPVFVEVGPSRVLSTFASAHETALAADIVATLPRPASEDDGTTGERSFLEAIGQIWLAGVDLDWEKLHRDDGRRRVPLPVYPFERVRHWIDAAGSASTEPVAVATPSAETFVDDATPAIERVANVWKVILDRAEIDPDEDFFRAGGHSLLAIQLRSRLERTFRKRVTLDQLFSRTTIRAQATFLESTGADAGGSAIARIDRSGRLPLSPAQERLWFIEQLTPGSPAFHIPEAVRMSGPLDVAALEKALADLVGRHESLRATFVGDGSGPFQRIDDRVAFALPFDDFEAVPPDARDEAVRALMRSEVRRPFDLETAPLFRARLVRFSAESHLLVLTLHHLVSDGWSMVLIERDLAALYAANVSGMPSGLPDLPIEFVDFVAWQRKNLEGEATAKSLESYRRIMSGASGALDLPLDRPRPRLFSYEGARRYVSWPRSAIDPVAHLAREAGATPFMAVLAAFSALLGRVSGQDDVIVGSPIACRSREEVENLVGFFVNTLPFRIDLSGRPDYRALLDRTRSAVTHGFAHADTPFHLVVEATGAPRDQSRAPLVQAMFVLETMVARMAPVRDLAMEQEEIDGGVAQVDLSLHLEEHPDGYRGWWEYATDLFDEATIDRFDRQLRTLLEAVAAAPNAPVGGHPLRSETELEHAWAEAAVRAVEVALPSTSLSGGFVATAERAPNAIALVDRVRRWTYREVHEATDRVARALVRRGVSRGRRVLVLADRSVASVLALIAVSKAGGVYVPADAGNPDERIRFIVSDCEAVVCLSPRDLRERAHALGIPAVSVEDLLDESDSPPVQLAAPSTFDLAYMIYTSGTTGKPKGVEVSHHAVLRLFGGPEAFFRFGADDVWVLLHSLAFDFSVWEMWGAFLYGGRLVTAEREARDPAALARLLVDERVTVLNQTPSAFRAMLQIDEVRALSSLRWIIFGGEALDLASLAGWFASAGATGPRLVNMYGITETTVHVTLREIHAEEVASEHRSVIGQPLPDLSLYVLDERMELVPEGAIGEIYVGGAGLAYGYHGRPALTAERFVPHPRPTAVGERLYRSGDLARVLAGGDFEYVGRADAQIKLRGFRIEPGEIEAALLRHPGVEDVRVLAQSSSAESRLVAYWIASRGESAPTEASLRAHAKATLPDYMVPAFFVALDRFPLTGNGKLDRGALPEPIAGSSGGLASSLRAPAQTPLEATVARAFAEILGHSSVGRDDSFFDLGGHSLLAARLVFRLREETGVMATLREFFDAPTVATLAAQLARGQTHIPRPAIVKLPRGRALPLSPSQREMFAFEELRPGTTAFHVPIAVRITGELDERAFADAYDAVLARHEVLRSRVGWFDGEAGQWPLPAGSFGLAIVDSSGTADRSAAWAALLEEETKTPFALDEGPLLRARLVRFSAVDRVLLGTAHHLAFDGWSIGTLVRDLVELYRANIVGEAPELPELPLQYADYAGWAASEATDVGLGFWKRYLDGAASIPEVPTDRPRDAGRETDLASASLPVVLPAEIWRPLLAFGRAAGATPYTILAAVYAAALEARFGLGEVLLGSPVALRSETALANLIGCFLGTVVLRVDLDEAGTAGEFVRRFGERTLEVLDHAETPFASVRRECLAARTGAPFHSWFVLQNLPRASMSVPGLTLESIAIDPPTTKFELALELTEANGGVEGRIFYRKALFDERTVERLVRTIESVARGMPSRSDRSTRTLLAEIEEEGRKVRGGLRLDALKRRRAETPKGGATE